jgi:hypothetical protein
MLAVAFSACSCDPVIAPPDGGTGGGATAGGGTGGSGGGAAAGGSGGGMGGGAGGGAATQFTEYVRALIATGTSDTGSPRAEAEWGTLPDDAPITFSPAFFDGGTN